MNREFIKWISEEMSRMKLTQKEVAGDTVQRSQISQVLSGKSNPGELFFLAISRAFNLPLDEVYRRAGIETGAIEPGGEVDLLSRKLAALPPESREAAESYIDYLRAKGKTDDDDDNDDARVEKARQLTTDQRLKVIKTADVISTTRRQRTPKKNRSDNRHPSTVRQSPARKPQLFQVGNCSGRILSGRFLFVTQHPKILLPPKIKQVTVII